MHSISVAELTKTHKKYIYIFYFCGKMQLWYDHCFKKKIQFWVLSCWNEEKVQYFKAVDNQKDFKPIQNYSVTLLSTMRWWGQSITFFQTAFNNTFVIHSRRKGLAAAICTQANKNFVVKSVLDSQAYSWKLSMPFSGQLGGCFYFHEPFSELSSFLAPSRSTVISIIEKGACSIPITQPYVWDLCSTKAGVLRIAIRIRNVPAQRVS